MVSKRTRVQDDHTNSHISTTLSLSICSIETKRKSGSESFLRWSWGVSATSFTTGQRALSTKQHHCCVYCQECHHFLGTATQWENKSYCLESASRLLTPQAEEKNNEDKEETRRIQLCRRERLQGSVKVRMGCVHGAEDILTLYCPSYSLKNMLSERVVNWNAIRPRKGWGLRYTTFHT